MSTESPARARTVASALPPIPPPTMTTSGFPKISGMSGGSGGKPHRQAAGPRDEIRGEPFSRTGGRDVGETDENFVQHHLYLDPRDMRTKTEMRSASAECDMIVGSAAHVEPVGVGKNRLVAIGRPVVDHHLVASANLFAPQLRIAHRRAPHVNHGAAVPQHFLDQIG